MPGGGRKRVGDPPGYPCPTAVPRPTRNNLLLPEDPKTVQRSQGVEIPPSTCEQGRLPRFAQRGPVQIEGWDCPVWEKGVPECSQAAMLCDIGQVT